MKTILDNDKRKPFSHLPALTVILFAAAGIILRVVGILSRLTYDEIWTVCHYISLPWYEIFTDLATPNNHCLNSLMIKWSTNLFSIAPAAIRLPVLLAGLLTMFLVIRASKKIREPLAAVITASWISFSSFLIYYSRVARGYSLQVFFVLAFFLLLLNQRTEKQRWTAAILLILSAAGTCLSVTSGIIFIGSFGGAYLLWMFPWKKVRAKWKTQVPFLTAGCLFLLLAALWYGCFYSKLKEGQQFGVEIHNPVDFVRFCVQTLHGLFLYPLVFLTAAGACIRKKNPYRNACLFVLTACGFVLLSALFTKAGPERVYLPLYAPFVITSAMTAAVIRRNMKNKKIFLPIFLAFIAIPLFFGTSMNTLDVPCCDSVADEMMADTPENVLIVYSRSDGIPVMFNSPGSIPDMRERLSGKVQLTGLLSIGNPTCLETMDFEGNDVNVPMDDCFRENLPARNGIPIVRYSLLPLSAGDDLKNSCLLMVLSSVSGMEFSLLDHELRQGEWLRLNPVFAGALSADGQISGAFLCRTPSRTAAGYQAMTAAGGNRIRFYRFCKTSEQE